MDATYDEDLTQNPFFMDFQNEHLELLHQCIAHGWIICVPRVGTVLSHAFTLQDFLGHILVCNEELPATHFMTLTEKTLRVINKVIFTDQNEVGLPFEIHVLFEETFYTTDNMKYIVWCIECPLELEVQLKDSNVSQCRTLSNLKDCIDFLWTESSGKEVFENMDTVILKFKSKLKAIKNMSINKLKDELSSLYTSCLQITFKNRRLKERSCACKNIMDNVKLSVESYVHHGIYQEAFDILSVCTAYQDATLNKIIRNLSDIQLRDLDVKNDFNQCIPSARKNLSLLQSYSTILGKVGCIKNTISVINKPSNNASTIFATTDELLPIFIFLVVKSGIPNWIAHLHFLKYFRFSVHFYFQSDEVSFCISTLEAAIEQIKSGIFSSCPCPESQSCYNNDSGDKCIHTTMSCANNDLNKISDLQYLFQQVKSSNFAKVKQILEQNTINKNNNVPKSLENSSDFNSKKTCLEEVLNDDNNLDLPLQLCHPLCSCSKCSHNVSKKLLLNSPTVFSCDDHGFTILHIASIYGQTQVVNLALEMGGNVNSTDYNGSTPLHYAASKGHQNIVLILLNAGADVNVQNMDKNSALHLACNNGHDCCVKSLIYFSEQNKNNICVGCENNNGDTPLHLASKWGYEIISKILIDYNADPWKTNRKGKTAVDLAHSKLMTNLLLSSVPNMLEYVDINVQSKHKKAEHPNDMNTAIALLDLKDDCSSIKPSNKNTSYRKESTIPNSTKDIHHIERVFNAIKHGDIKLACFYMNIDETNKSNSVIVNQQVNLCHPLCVCTKCNILKWDENRVENNSFDINTCDSQGNTCLHMAVKHNMLEFCEILLIAGAKPDVKNNFGSTPLHVASKGNRVSIAMLLLKHINNLKCKDSMGNTPLHVACIAGSTEIVKILLEYEPYEAITNFSQKTPLDEAKDKLYLTIIALIEDSSSNSNI